MPSGAGVVCQLQCAVVQSGKVFSHSAAERLQSGDVGSEGKFAVADGERGERVEFRHHRIMPPNERLPVNAAKEISRADAGAAASANPVAPAVLMKFRRVKRITASGPVGNVQTNRAHRRRALSNPAAVAGGGLGLAPFPVQIAQVNFGARHGRKSAAGAASQFT